MAVTPTNVKFLDSCDHYDLASDIAQKWTENIGSTSSTTAQGRNGRGLNVRDGIAKTLNYSSSWVVGAAVNFKANGAGFNHAPLYQLKSAGNLTLAQLIVESDGTLSLWAGNRLNFIANSSTASPPVFLFNNRFYYIECKTIISGTTPMSVTMTLYVNGITVISGTASTGVNAADTLLGIAQANFHEWDGGGTGGNAAAVMDDFYIADLNGGGALTDHAGDLKVSALFPRADVTFQWAAVGGSTSTGWDHVNCQFPEINDDTVYIADNTPGDIANFDWQPVATFTGTIIAVHYGVYARKDDEGTRTFQQTTHGIANSVVWSPGDSYGYFFFAMDNDPATSLAWTQANFNASTFGLVEVS